MMTYDDLFCLMEHHKILGLRFQPTELELIEYLERHVRWGPIDPDLIPVVDLNLTEPYRIPELCQPRFPGDKHEWYLIHSCCKKYSGSTKEDRSTPQGYWKATGRPTRVCNKLGHVVGNRKTLVFYKGRAKTKSQPGCRNHSDAKTEWIMHEFRSELPGLQSAAGNNKTWVICSITNKPAAPAPSPGPASPSSGAHSDRSYSPGPPSVTSEGGADFPDFFPSSTPPASEGSSPIQIQGVLHIHPPQLELPSPSFGNGSPHAPDSAGRLRRSTAFVSRLPAEEDSQSYHPQPSTSPSGNLSNIPSFERWGTESLGNWEPTSVDQTMDALQFQPPPPITHILHDHMDVDSYLVFQEQGLWNGNN